MTLVAGEGELVITCSFLRCFCIYVTEMERRLVVLVIFALQPVLENQLLYQHVVAIIKQKAYIKYAMVETYQLNKMTQC